MHVDWGRKDKYTKQEKTPQTWQEKKKKKCCFILYPRVEVNAPRHSLHPSEFTPDHEKQHELQRGRKWSGLLRRKCFKWQLTALGLWGRSRIFWQDSASILLSPLHSVSNFLLSPPRVPLISQALPSFLYFPLSDTAVRKVCSCCHFFYLELPLTDSLCLSLA